MTRLLLLEVDASLAVHLVAAIERHERRLRDDARPLPLELQALLRRLHDMKRQVATPFAGAISNVDDAVVDPLPRLLTLDDVGDRLRVAPRTVQRYVADGRLPVVRLGGRTLFRPGDVADFLDQMQAAPTVAQEAG